MKLKNKKTGEMGDLIIDKDSLVLRTSTVWGHYSSLAELNAEWEVYEGPEEYYFITDFGSICARDKGKIVEDEEGRKQIGNYFDTREEAELAVEKLKALTKLCKKGFEFNSVEMFGSGVIGIEASIPINEKTTLQERSDIVDDLYLLFGGEE